MQTKPNKSITNTSKTSTKQLTLLPMSNKKRTNEQLTQVSNPTRDARKRKNNTFQHPHQPNHAISTHNTTNPKPHKKNQFLLSNFKNMKESKTNKKKKKKKTTASFDQ